MSDTYSNGAAGGNTLESLKAEREDLNQAVACVRQMTRDFDAMTERRKSLDAENTAFHLQMKGPDMRRCVWAGVFTPEGFQWHKALMARKKALWEQTVKDVAAYGEALVRWAENLEMREKDLARKKNALQQNGHGATPSVDLVRRAIETYPDVAIAAYTAGYDALPIAQNAAAGYPDATTDEQLKQSGISLSLFAEALASHGTNPYDESYNITDQISNTALQYYLAVQAQRDIDFIINHPIAYEVLETIKQTLGNYFVQVALIMTPVASEIAGSITDSISTSVSDSIDASTPTRFNSGPGGSPININSIRFKGQAGKSWEQDVVGNLPRTQTNVVSQISTKSHGPSGLVARLDAAGKLPDTGTNALTDAKLSPAAPLTHNQIIVYPELEVHGGVVIGKGKAPFSGGTVIPPTKVNIITPQDNQ